MTTTTATTNSEETNEQNMYNKKTKKNRSVCNYTSWLLSSKKKKTHMQICGFKCHISEQQQ